MYKIYGVVLFFGALSNTNFAFRFIIFYLFTFFLKKKVFLPNQWPSELAALRADVLGWGSKRNLTGRPKDKEEVDGVPPFSWSL